MSVLHLGKSQKCEFYPSSRQIVLGYIFYELKFIHAIWLNPMINGGFVFI
jgi:hypothetical protein